jgi:cation diffusion facilitator CzcD-associated flavoprotein CzcO
MSPSSNGAGIDYDVVIVGAGITGIHQLYRVREAGFSVRVLEAGGGVGGTWYWNRYPLARFDSESYTYGYFFSKDLQAEWDWKEHFAGQPEVEAYLNYVVDKFAMRDDIQFNARVVSATFDDAANVWTLVASDGTTTRARFFIAASGILSAPYYADVPGKDDYRGEMYHTGEWPVEPVDFKGKRVAVIGTGASAVQLVPAIAGEVESLTVYQRTANWCAPLNNSRITPEEQAEIKANYDELYKTVHSTFAGFLHADGTKATFDDSREERWAFYEQLWQTRGFAKLFSNYTDLVTDPAANKEFCEFLAEKIRTIVKDPVTADKLIPKDHGFGMKRPPMETGYYDAFNRPNVTLVDLRATPIVRITETGVETTDGHVECDIIVWATGFDAFTGALTRMGIRGTGGRTLNESWAEGPRTYLGIASPGFPNLLLAGGPHGTYGNVPRSTETQVEFIMDILRYLRHNNYERIEPTETAEEQWTSHVYEISQGVLTAETAWYIGSNIPGKAKRFLLYVGGLPTYKEKVNAVAANDLEGFALTPAADPAVAPVT